MIVPSLDMGQSARQPMDRVDRARHAKESRMPKSTIQEICWTRAFDVFTVVDV
jgi:hypothetical protein